MNKLQKRLWRKFDNGMTRHYMRGDQDLNKLYEIGKELQRSLESTTGEDHWWFIGRIKKMLNDILDYLKDNNE